MKLINNKNKTKFCTECETWVPFSKWKTHSEIHKELTQIHGQVQGVSPKQIEESTQKRILDLQSEVEQLRKQNDAMKNALRILGILMQAMYD